VAGTRRYHNTSASQFYSCALTLAGKGQCWGSNPRGELGNGTTTDTDTPGFVAGNLTFAQLSAGYSHACGVTTEGLAYCWGDNGVGALGDGTTTRRLAPVPVAAPM
jgi:alpha-tubulin suppressor-like RCC1 family protein